MLEAKDPCDYYGCLAFCEDWSIEFIFDASIGTRGSSRGAIKNLYGE